VEVTAEPTDAWFDTWFGVMSSSPAARATARRILEQVGPVSGYATLASNGTPVAVGRAVAERGWAGIFGMATLPEARGRGAATAVLAALAAWAADHHATCLYLQVSSGNQDAERLYHRAGFDPHHTYRYRNRQV
jgi:N-acetylglutamate synthase